MPGAISAQRSAHPPAPHPGADALRRRGWSHSSSPPRRRPPFRCRPPGRLAGLEALIAQDPRLAPIEAAAGPLPWRGRPPGFPGLLRAICGQQISNQAAAAIWRRLSAIPGALDPAGLLAMDDATLCGVAGLSRPKAAHARSLATACLEGGWISPRADARHAEAVAHIAAVKGLGPWTAEIHLLFAEQRLDVFPAATSPWRRARRICWGWRRGRARRRWRAGPGRAPWRSLAARLLWHHWRFVTGRPVVEDG